MNKNMMIFFKKKVDSSFIRLSILKTSTFLVNIFFVFLLVDVFKFSESRSYLISSIIILIISYLITTIWVFKEKITSDNAIKYISITLLLIFISEPFYSFLSQSINYLVATTISLGGVFLVKYLLYKTVVYGNCKSNVKNTSFLIPFFISLLFLVFVFQNLIISLNSSLYEWGDSAFHAWHTDQSCI